MRLGDGNVLGFFKSGLDADAHGLITIAVSTIFLFVFLQLHMQEWRSTF